MERSNANSRFTATLQWQLDQHLGSYADPGPAMSIEIVPESENDHRVSDNVVLDDYVPQANILNETDLTLAGINSTSLATTAITTPALTIGSSLAAPLSTTTTAPSVASGGAGIDLSGWTDWLDWQEPDSLLVPPPGMDEAILADHVDQVGESPIFRGARFEVTDLMRADL